MTRLLHLRIQARLRPGFTLAEVLVAVAVLLIGVLVALKIFPTGFNLFNEAQQTHIALRMLNQTLTNFEEDPQGLPDAILPVDYDASAQAASLPSNSYWLMGDLNATDYEAASGIATMLSPYLAPDGSWPLWQPTAVRAMRRIIGERCLIPTDVYNWIMPTNSNSATNVSIMPSYVPRFAPMVSNGHWDSVKGYYQPEINPVTIYDLRYRRVTLEQLQGLLANISQLPDHLYYAIDNANQQLWLLPDANRRNIRIACYSLDTTRNNQLQYRRLPLYQQNPSANLTALLPISFTSLGIAPTEVLVPGSEQLNRAFIQVTDISTRTLNGKTNVLNSGEYYIYGFANTKINNTNPSTGVNSIFFSQADGGHVVKIDYTAADWNILHEDLAVDKDGYLTLAVPDPKIEDKPLPPREPSTLAVDGPMNDDGYDVVLKLVDLSTGVSYRVFHDPKSNPPYTIELPTNKIRPTHIEDQPDPFAKLYPTSLDSIDLSAAHQGRVRLGSQALNSANPWATLTGHKFRVFYRAQHDWTLQVYKPPSAFWRMPANSNLGWCGFAVNANQVTVPSVYQGQSVGVDYVYQPELCRTINDATTGATQLLVGDTSHIMPNMLLQIYNTYNFVPWTKSTAYTVGQWVVPSSANGSYYICTTAGVTAGSEPAWIKTLGTPINDGSVVWTCENPSLTTPINAIVQSVDNANQFTVKTPLAANQPIAYGAFLFAHDPLCMTQPGAATVSGATVTLQVNNVAALKPAMPVVIYNPDAAGLAAPQTATITSILTTRQIVVQALTPGTLKVEPGAYITAIQNPLPLQQASGELHTIPTGANANGVFRLKHLPLQNSPINVRGMSVTVRALWIQPRHGSAWQVDGAPSSPTTWPWNTRSLSEQWQAKTLTAILPATKD